MLEGVGVDEKIGRTIDLDANVHRRERVSRAASAVFSEGPAGNPEPRVLPVPDAVQPGAERADGGAARDPVDAGQTSSRWSRSSIDPTETFDLAQKKQALYLGNYGKPAPGWHFLDAITRATPSSWPNRSASTIRYDEAQQQYAHAAAIMVLTPDGKMARYLYGISFSARDLRLALTEAARRQGQFTIDRCCCSAFTTTRNRDRTRCSPRT